MKNKKIKVITIGSPDITLLNTEEQTTFYSNLLARILELKKQN